MKAFQLELSFKTRFFNFFRKLFTIPYFENILLKTGAGKLGGFVSKLVPPGYLYKKKTYRTVIRNGITYRLDISNSIDNFVYFNFPEKTYDTVTDVIKQADVIIDIGANIGITTLFFASLNEKAKVYAFEPHLKSFMRCKENASLNNFKNITYLNKGLGAVKGFEKLYEIRENNPGMNRILKENKNVPFTTITIDTLDDFTRDKNISKIDFIKIDVEGYEYEVIYGGRKTIAESKPVMLVELDDNNLREHNRSARELLLLLQELGYNTFYHAIEHTVLLPENDFRNCHFDVVAK